jgi:hypothetical protein
MTVKELIEILECFGDEAEVVFSDYTELSDVANAVTTDDNKEYAILR